MESCLIIPAKTKSNQFSRINKSCKVYIVKCKVYIIKVTFFDTTFISLNNDNVQSTSQIKCTYVTKQCINMLNQHTKKQ